MTVLMGGRSAFGVSMTPLNSGEITLCFDSVEGGSICLWYLYVFSIHSLTIPPTLKPGSSFEPVIFELNKEIKFSC